MPRPKIVVPSYRLHVGTGQAVVTVPGPGRARKDIYLGAHGSDVSVIRYAHTLLEWKAAGAAVVAEGTLTVNELLEQFLDHAKRHYGDPSKELTAYKYAITPTRELFGLTPAAAFGPKALKAIRQRMIDIGWCRKLVNRQAGRVRRMFKWAVSEELIPAAVLEGLRSVVGLARGRSAAPESAPVKPVADADIEAVLPYMTPTVRGLVMFQRLTGCRPGEAVQLRMTMIDRTAAVWLYRPARHKGEWCDRERIVPVGPKAQMILEKLATDVTGDAPVFSPRRAVAERCAMLRGARKSKVQPSQLDRRKKRPGRVPGEQYSVPAFNRAVTYAIAQANAARVAEAKGRGGDSPAVLVPHWHVNQLRHAKATEIRKGFGLEAAQTVLGHAQADVTQVYAERDLQLALRVARETG